MKKPQSGSRTGWIIQGRDLPGRQTPQNIGIIWLPAPIVTLADECGSDGIQGSRTKAAGTLIKVAGILMKDRLHDDAANDDAVDCIGILRPETLPIALHALTDLVVTVPRLLDSRGNRAGQDSGRIEDGLPAELKFLRGIQRRRIRVIGNEVVRKNPQQALLLLRFQLLHREFLRR